MALDMNTYKLNVHGRVQGVGFRYFVKQTADRIGVVGEVRNLHDGSVEVTVTCEREAFDILLKHLWKGPRMSHVDDIQISEIEFRTYADFDITF